MTFRHYVALGDSISIDEYPGLDWAETDAAGYTQGLGAASLLRENNDTVWPSFSGLDLATLCPGIGFTNLAADGATTQDVLAHQLPHLRSVEAFPVLVTLTAGGNDLLQMLGQGREPDVDAILSRLRDAVWSTLETLPEPTLVLSTVYDPSDGAPQRLAMSLGTAELRLLARLNQGVRELCQASERVLLADLHERFLGHGLGAPAEARWYWRHMIIEPSARGASEVRRTWLRVLHDGERVPAGPPSSSISEPRRQPAGPTVVEEPEEA
jgi:lysophospholipase L1-like esterase